MLLRPMNNLKKFKKKKKKRSRIIQAVEFVMREKLSHIVETARDKLLGQMDRMTQE